MLRARQVQLVRDILQATARGGGGACVKQMLMGGGKTTVVSPLLCLMLGDGARLVLQVVPPALLEFSRGVMRSTFNSVITKPVVTLDVDRNTLVDARTVEKLRGAIASRGVVIATPTTIKAVVLKYVEACEILSDARHKQIAPEAAAAAASAAAGLLVGTRALFFSIPPALPPTFSLPAPGTRPPPPRLRLCTACGAAAAAATFEACTPAPPALVPALAAVTSAPMGLTKPGQGGTTRPAQSYEGPLRRCLPARTQSGTKGANGHA